MTAAMVGENVRFKINFLMYNILTKLNKRKSMLQEFYLEWYMGIAEILTHFQHYGCVFL